MKSEIFRVLSTIVLVIAIGNLATSCSPEDGVDGINGTAGLNGVDGADGIGADGTDGADGADGADGEDGVDGEDGLADLAQYGSVSVTMTGTRPDNDVAFTKETVLKFIHNESGSNDVDYYDSDINFDFRRFLNSPDSHEDNSIEFELNVLDAGLVTQDFELSIDFNNILNVFDDHKYIEWNSDFSETSTGVTNFAITDYSFNDTTNNLKYSFTLDVDGANNQTGNALTISGTVDIIVLEQIENQI